MSYDNLDVAIEGDAQTWGSELISNIKNCFNELEQNISKDLVRRITGLNQSLSDKLNKLVTKVNDTAVTANKALQLAELNAKRLDGLKRENVYLRNKLNASENFSRRNNIVISGITDSSEEINTQCVNKVKTFFSDELSIDKSVIDSFSSIYCQRLGIYEIQKTRAILVKFSDHNNKQTVFKEKINLKGTKCFMSLNFSSTVEKNRRQLYPVYKEAKKLYKKTNVKLFNDQLFIGDTCYTAENMCDLPTNVNPLKLSIKSKRGLIVFGGLFSRFQPLSNWYSAPTKYKGHNFTTVEQAYQHAKSMFFNDTDTADKILSSNKPEDALKLGRKVKDFNQVAWNVERNVIMKAILREKFTQNNDLKECLMDTGVNKLAESGINKYFAVGIGFMNKNILSSTSWDGDNMLGNNLMDLRKELK